MSIARPGRRLPSRILSCASRHQRNYVVQVFQRSDHFERRVLRPCNDPGGRRRSGFTSNPLGERCSGARIRFTVQLRTHHRAAMWALASPAPRRPGRDNRWSTDPWCCASGPTRLSAPVSAGNGGRHARAWSMFSRTDAGRHAPACRHFEETLASRIQSAPATTLWQHAHMSADEAMCVSAASGERFGAPFRRKHAAPGGITGPTELRA